MAELTSWKRPRIILYFLAIYGVISVLFLQPFSWYPSLINSQQEWQAFAHDYHKRFGRRPPRGMETWLEHAQQHRCETRDFYESLDQDLKYFRDQIIIGVEEGNHFFDFDQVIEEGKKVTDHYMGLSLENHKLTVLDYKGNNGNNNNKQRKSIERLIHKLLKPTIQHSPPLNSTFFFNLHDTAVAGSANTKYPLFSVCKMDYYTDNQQPPPATRMNTTTTPASALNISYRPGPEFVASKDLLVPWWFGLRKIPTKFWFWPFYGSGLPFWLRQNAITWRGSTTGAWETGPRFRLVKEYGGGGKVHNLHNKHTTTDVNADFAFIRIVQKPGEVPPLSSGYRFARHMYYWQMQLRKYILDVDGNGKDNECLDCK